LGRRNPARRPRSVDVRFADAVEVERRHIDNVLQTTQWRIEGPGGAAHILGMKPSTLRSRMAKLGIVRGR